MSYIVALPDGNRIEVSVGFAPITPVSTRRKYRMRRFARLVKAAAYAAAAKYVGQPYSREAAESIASVVLAAMRETAQRYAHLKTIKPYERT